jgi:hypothetical protein
MLYMVVMVNVMPDDASSELFMICSFGGVPVFWACIFLLKSLRRHLRIDPEK